MGLNMGVTIPYTLGPDIYVGWVAGSLCLIAAGLLVYDSCQTPEDEDELDDTTDKVDYSTSLINFINFSFLNRKSRATTR